jgi:hypothetical protein
LLSLNPAETKIKRYTLASPAEAGMAVAGRRQPKVTTSPSSSGINVGQASLDMVSYFIGDSLERRVLKT